MTDANPAGVALAAFLRDRPVTGSWETAREQERPLVASRRGSPDRWANTGVRFHRVALKPLWLARWASHRIAAGEDFGGPVGGGAALTAALLEVRGVRPVYNITPLDTPGRAHRVVGWVAADPEVFDVVLDEDTREAVNNPWSRL